MKKPSVTTAAAVLGVDVTGEPKPTGATFSGTVRDAKALPAGATITVTVKTPDRRSASGSFTFPKPPPPPPANKPPVANAGGPYQGVVGVPVQFDGSRSSDPDGTIAKYEWGLGNFGAGEVRRDGVRVDLTYVIPGTYTITLTVTDNRGATASATTTATISAAPPPPSTGPRDLLARAVAPLEVRLTWTHANAAEGTRYQVERANPAGGWFRVGTAHAPFLRFTDPGREPATSYTYRLRAVDGSSVSAYTSPATVTTLATRTAEEFNGPFEGWKAVTAYGAGQGGDDTQAINQALADLFAHRFPVLYFPAGTYRISGTIGRARGSDTGLGMSLVGEDPESTRIVWTGPAGGRMMQLDAWYSKVSRLTFDGSGIAGEGLLWGDGFSTFNETSDCVFQDMGTGLRLGYSVDEGNGHESQGQAEQMVLRNRFLRCRERGVRINQANSLDIWCWWNHFEGCGYGIDHLRGNFMAYHNRFEGSTNADIHGGAPEFFGIVGNYSRRSFMFLDFPTGPSTIANNRVIEPTSGTAIRLLYSSPHVLLDNQFRQATGVTKAPVEMGQFAHLFVGNLYDALVGALPYPYAGESIYRRVDEEEGLPGAVIDPHPPALPGTPPKVRRPVYEVTPGGNLAAAIQAAAARPNERPVVHLAAGGYPVTTPLVIPAGADLTLVGDGVEQVTTLEWMGAPGGGVLQATGPVSVRIQEMAVRSLSGSGLAFTGINQGDSQVYANQVAVMGYEAGAQTGFLLDRLENADVWLLGVQGTGCREYLAAVGGTRAGAGQVTPGRMAALTGAVGRSHRLWRVENGARFTARGIYNEMPDEGVSDPNAVTMDGRGDLALDACKLAYFYSATTPLFDVRGAVGDLCVVGGKWLARGSEYPRVFVRGDGTGAGVLVAGVLYGEDVPIEAWQDTSAPQAAAGYLLNRYDDGGAWRALPPRGTGTDAHLRRMLALLRSTTVSLPQPGGAGRTTLLLHRVRVSVGAGFTGMRWSA